MLARDREPGEAPRGHVAVPEPNRRRTAGLTTVWTRSHGIVALVPTSDGDGGDRTALIEVTQRGLQREATASREDRTAR